MRYRKAIQKLIPPGTRDPAIKPVGVIYHVAVSQSDSLYDYFAHRSGGIESHFYVREDGTIEQYRDTGFEADAQSQGNSFLRGSTRCGFISVETEGMGAGMWTPEQVKALIAIGEWAARVHRFRRKRCTGPFTDGFGYHRMFREWNPNSHSCPGDARVKQFDDTILPALLGPPSRVSRARVLLRAAVRSARRHNLTHRLRRIRDGLRRLPKE